MVFSFSRTSFSSKSVQAPRGALTTLRTMSDPCRTHRPLRILLTISAACEVLWFTSSHWFWHRRFFNLLAVHGPDLESTFVISQLQLIGAMVMGYALTMLLIARDPVKYREVLRIVLFTGVIAALIFVGNVVTGRMSPMFLINASMLTAQFVAATFWFPKPDAA